VLLNTRIFATLLLLVSVAIPCSAQQIEGTWEWVSTEYLAGGADTPATVGHTIQLQFGSDGSFVRYENEVPAHVGTWGMYDVVITPYMVGIVTTSAGDSWWSQSLGGEAVLTLTLKDWVDLPSGRSGPATRTETYTSREAVATESMSWSEAKLKFR
jgi:hypothetical protein